jgi:hypothetical protein
LARPSARAAPGVSGDIGNRQFPLAEPRRQALEHDLKRHGRADANVLASVPASGAHVAESPRTRQSGALIAPRWSFVIGRNTAFTYKCRAVDLTQIGGELNVRYVLEGSVQRGGAACA